jgi:hypothetical protein
MAGDAMLNQHGPDVLFKELGRLDLSNPNLTKSSIGKGTQEYSMGYQAQSQEHGISIAEVKRRSQTGPHSSSIQERMP